VSKIAFHISVTSNVASVRFQELASSKYYVDKGNFVHIAFKLQGNH